MGCAPIATDGIFGKTTTCSVKEFQSRYCDFQGNPLVIDGKVGIQTWTSLFGISDILNFALSLLIIEVIKIARKELGVSEDPPCSNTVWL